MYKLGSKASFPSSPTTNNETHQKLQQGGGGGGGGAARQRQRQRRVSFSAEVRRVLLPRIAYTDLVGDVRDPGHNPNYAALGQARADSDQVRALGGVPPVALSDERAPPGTKDPTLRLTEEQALVLGARPAAPRERPVERSAYHGLDPQGLGAKPAHGHMIA